VTRSSSQLVLVGKIATIAVLYVLAARAGLQLDAISGFATLVWPPTGIALAALLLGGFALWPGVFLGAVVANILTGAPLLIAGGIGIGNTLEALLAAYALTRLAKFHPAIDRVRDAVGLIILSALLSPLVSATIGVMTLHFGGIVPRGQVAEAWRAWWLGDAIGALLVAPPLLVWTARPVFASTRRLLEAILLAASVIVTSLLIFSAPNVTTPAFNQAYLIFPVMIWAAVRFGQHGAVSTSLVVSVIAVWATATGHGPFLHNTLHGSLFALQIFAGVTASTFLVLGAATAERERAVRELRIAHGIAATANQAKAEFLAVMSHELRTPLNAIAGYAELLELGIPGALNSDQKDAVVRIHRNEQHLLNLIDDVLTFARAEAGASSLNTRQLTVCNELDALEPLLEPQLRQKRLELKREPCDTKLEVCADPTKLRQILANIAGNAIKFTPAGGSIYISAVSRGDDVLISVADTGIGVPSDKLSQIFEPFFQLNRGMTREYSGVGLGLAIARDLAREMGGDIFFGSELGRGSVVSVALPVRQLQ